MIYLILNSGFKDNNPDETIKMLKIGYTDNLEGRLKAYQVTNPGFILLDTREGDTKVESYLHKRFEKYRYSDNSREWFHYSQEIIDNFHCDPEEIIDEGVLLECIKKDLRSKITPISELKEKYLDQILEELRSSEYFSEELYDKDVLTYRIVDTWQAGLIILNRIIDEAALVNFQPVNLSDANVDSLTVDITLDLPQILGRQRLEESPWKNRAELYYRSVLNKNITVAEDFKEFIQAKMDRTESLLRSYGNALDIEKHHLADIYQYVAKTKNYKDNYVAVNVHGGKDLVPVINNLVLVSEIRAFQIQQVDYKDRFSVFKAVSEELDIENKAIMEFIEEFESKSLFPEKMKLLCECNLSEDTIKVILDLLPIVFKNYYVTLGKARIKSLNYRKNFLDKECSRLKENQENSGKLKDLIYDKVEIGKKYTKQYLKELLAQIYVEAGIKEAPKSTALEEYFELKKIQTTNKETGKRDNGFLIVGIKS